MQEAPGAIVHIQALLAKKNPTAADFEAAKKRIQEDVYNKVVPNADKFPVLSDPVPVPPTPPVPPVPGNSGDGGNAGSVGQQAFRVNPNL